MASSIGLSIGYFKTVFDMLVKACDAYKSSPQAFKGLLSEYESLASRTKKRSPRKGPDSRKASKGSSLPSVSNRTLDSEPSSNNRLRVAVALSRRDSIQETTTTGDAAVTSHNAAQVAQRKEYPSSIAIPASQSVCLDHGIDILEAAQQQDWRKVKRLISPTVELSSPQFQLSLTFQLAIQSSAWDIVEILVSKGIDPNGKSLNKRPAILVAASDKAWSVVKLLAQRGADLSVTNSKGHTVLLLAALYRKWDMVYFLASAGADIRVKGTFFVYSKITVLSYAATHKDWIHVEQLLNRGADPNFLVLNGDPILVAAAAQQQWSAVGALLEKDVGVNEPGRDGKTALTHVLSSMRSTTENPRKFEKLSRILKQLVLKGAIFGRKELELCSNGTIGEEIWRCMLTPENLAADLSFSS
ncbi:ankyrin repeat-containing domain protein [Aspergillus novoparasiticus]|uniref:Ankyrin repeat-containing domain protein n=1 Tax=Aspergillus novoparasiticus TaxID=986946 RepID=A0A5N6ENX4_9EURO|nr:ankyrin repeat-containing domain protein [Aspergillus novoparasiticus]